MIFTRQKQMEDLVEVRLEDFILNDRILNFFIDNSDRQIIFIYDLIEDN